MRQKREEEQRAKKMKKVAYENKQNIHIEKYFACGNKQDVHEKNHFVPESFSMPLLRKCHAIVEKMSG